jgi:predicted ATPase
MAKIKILNFGAIKAGLSEGLSENEGFIDIKKVTLFIGNQGVGKSTVAKLISTLSWIEKALVRGDVKEKNVTATTFRNKYCAYQNLDTYFKKDTTILYRGTAYHIDYKNESIHMVKIETSEYIVPKIMYIPAERNFVSAVDRPDKLKNLPAPLLTFLTEYEKAKDEIKENILLPINDTSFEYDKLNKIAHIKGTDYKVRLTNASSGFQSAVPLFLVSKSLALSIRQDASKKELSADEEKRIKIAIEKILSNDKLTEEIKHASLELLSARFKNAAFINIVEEPEQNLFPFSQKEILFKLLEFSNFSTHNKLIMTTHSPYIVNYLTLAIKAYNVLQNCTADKTEALAALTKIIPKEACVFWKDVVIYQIENNGTLSKLADYEGLPSDENFLNNFLTETNELFINLLEIEQTL